MNDEKLLILNMLEEGKINPKEAIELLDALDKNPDSSEDSPKSSYKNLDSFGARLSETISDTITGLVASIKNIDFGPASGNYEVLEKNITEDISYMDNPTLDISTVNGFINIEAVDSHKLMIKLEAKYKDDENLKIEDLYSLSLENNTIKFRPSFKSKYTSLSLNILLPRGAYDSSLIASKNGNISLKDLNMSTLKINNSNGRVKLSNMELLDTTIKTSNGKVYVENIKGDKLDILTSNGSIDLVNLSQKFIYAKTSNAKVKANKLKAFNININTSNGSILANETDSNLLELKSSNGSINISLPRRRSLSYDLSTSFGDINLDRNDLVYEEEKLDQSYPKVLLAKTKDYDLSTNKTDIIAATSHGSISIDSYLK